ncbi:MAG: winged helix-turn-helix domain-containing protein [Candidatus Nanohalobium sp.]
MPTTKDNPSPRNSADRKYNLIIDEVTEKVMRVLLENPKIPYTKSSLAEASNVSRDALYRRWDKFKELGIIEEAPTGGKQEYYRLNSDSEIVNEIGKLLYLEQ